MLSVVLTLFFILICLLLLVVVLLQQGKGGDIAAAFGGSSSQTAFGARAGATVLTRATTILGTLFLVIAFLLGIVSRGGGGSVVSGIDAPAGSQPAAPALPMTNPPPATPPGGGSGSTPAPQPPPNPAPVEPGKGEPAKGGGS